MKAVKGNIACVSPVFSDRTVRPCYSCRKDTRFCEKCMRDHHLYQYTGEEIQQALERGETLERGLTR